MADSSSDPYLSSLRQLAQSHLTEINTLNNADVAADAKRRSDWHDEWAHRATLTKAKSKPQKRVTRHLGPKRPQKSQSAQMALAGSSSDDTTATNPTDPTSREVKELPSKPKLRSATDVLHRLLHDPVYTPQLHLYRIGYLDRLEGIRTVSVHEWLDRSEDQDSDEWVPMHRIRWFMKVSEGHEEVGHNAGEGKNFVWHRFNKIDRIFGSVVGTEGMRTEFRPRATFAE